MSKVGFARRSLHDATECGDACGYVHLDARTLLYVIDGLGHGKYAEEAAQAAVACVKESADQDLVKILSHCDAAIFHSRGAAVGLANIDETRGELTYAGVGNTRIIYGKRRLKSFNSDAGIVGTGFGRVREEKAQLAPGDMVVMYTDGLKTDIRFGSYDRALHADAARLAERILHDSSRGTDDVGVIVYRYEATHDSG